MFLLWNYIEFIILFGFSNDELAKHQQKTDTRQEAQTQKQNENKVINKRKDKQNKRSEHKRFVICWSTKYEL